MFGRILAKIYTLFPYRIPYQINECVKDVYSLHLIAPLYPQSPYTPLTGYSMSPTMLAHLANEVTILDKKVIVELGSGISTLVLAKLIALNNMKQTCFISIDHDTKWQDTIADQLRENQLLDRVTLINAGLVSDSTVGGDGKWYDREILKTALPGQIDLLIVDGPPEYCGDRARYPAVPFLRDSLHENYSIFLDDTYRGSETAIMKSWRSMLDGQYQDYGKYGVITTNRTICTSPPAVSSEDRFQAMIAKLRQGR